MYTWIISIWNVVVERKIRAEIVIVLFTILSDVRISDVRITEENGYEQNLEWEISNPHNMEPTQVRLA